MERKIYHKLVRDRIPQIIADGGGSCTVDVLDDSSYLQMLDEKLEEELAEYRQSGELEELADLLEVMEAAVKARGYTWEDLRRVQLKKRQERGGFEKKLLLKEVMKAE